MIHEIMESQHNFGDDQKILVDISDLIIGIVEDRLYYRLSQRFGWWSAWSSSVINSSWYSLRSRLHRPSIVSYAGNFGLLHLLLHHLLHQDGRFDGLCGEDSWEDLTEISRRRKKRYNANKALQLHKPFLTSFYFLFILWR